MSTVTDVAGQMSNPNDFRLLLALVYLTLALFGLTYNRLVEWMESFPSTRGMTSFAVVIGVMVTGGLVVLAFGQLWLPGWAWGVLMLGAFACSGWPMIIGQRARYARSTAEDAKRRNGKKPLRWPNNMKSLRDGAAEEAIAGLRALNGLDTEVQNIKARERISRVKLSLIKIAALLVQAGAPVTLEDI